MIYLEARAFRWMPAPDAYAPELRRAWRAAQPDLACAQGIGQRERLNYSPRDIFMQRSPTITRLRSLIWARHDYFFLAEQFLRAAEQFGSVRLLDQSQPYLRAILEEAAFVQSLEGHSATDGLIALDVQPFRSDELRMRSAVLRARLSRSPNDLATAEAVLNTVKRPDLLRIGDLAFRGGDSFCDFGEQGRDAEELVVACREESNVQDTVVSYWVNRALLDIVADSGREEATEVAMRLIAFEQLENYSQRCCSRNGREDRQHLLLARAERNVRAIAVAGGASEEVHDLWEEAARDVQRAGQVIAPAEEPARFRRVANLWLSLWALADRVDDPDDYRAGPAASPNYRRFNAYVRVLLDRLDAIAVGEAATGS